jgi:single-stranded-DNA-specific exonuclease
MADVNGDAVSVEQAAFRLCPRLNAAGRMADPTTALRLLLASSDAEGSERAGELGDLNRMRQEEDGRVAREALEMARAQIEEEDPPIVVVGGEGWHPGVVGIVAARVVEKTHRPAIVIGLSDGIGRGSGRSLAGIDLVGLLDAVSHHLVKYGGHRAAVGLTVHAEAVEEFRRGLVRAFVERYPDFAYEPELKVDAIWEPSDDVARLTSELAAFAPFGNGFPEPTLLLARMAVVHAKKVGTDHLKLQLAREGTPVEAIGFRLAPEPFELPPLIDCVGYPELHSYHGLSYHRVVIRDFRKSGTI